MGEVLCMDLVGRFCASDFIFFFLVVLLPSDLDQHKMNFDFDVRHHQTSKSVCEYANLSALVHLCRPRGNEVWFRGGGL